TAAIRRPRFVMYVVCPRADASLRTSANWRRASATVISTGSCSMYISVLHSTRLGERYTLVCHHPNTPSQAFRTPRPPLQIGAVTVTSGVTAGQKVTPVTGETAV